MAVTAAQTVEMGVRRVQRAITESVFINTLNLADRITLDFVFFPGADVVGDSLIDFVLPLTAANPAPRDVQYKWSRRGMADLVRNVAFGRITLPLAPGTSGELSVFDTKWEIARAAAGVTLTGAASIKGIQERLNILGYHLRAPGATARGTDNVNGLRTERAVLSFQVDYRRPAGAPAVAPAGPLPVRGEVAANPGLQNILDRLNRVPAGTSANPSAADSAQMQAALVAIVGA